MTKPRNLIFAEQQGSRDPTAIFDCVLGGVLFSTFEILHYVQDDNMWVYQ
jgi:hypothetical protein